VPIALGFILLPFAIHGLHMSPYLAMTAVLGINAVISYFSTSHFEAHSMETGKNIASIATQCYNEEENVRELYERVRRAIEGPGSYD